MSMTNIRSAIEPHDFSSAKMSITTTYAVSEKTQEVVNVYENYVAGGFAPYPVGHRYRISSDNSGKGHVYDADDRLLLQGSRVLKAGM